MGGRMNGGKGLPVDVFPVGAEIGCCVDFVLEELVWESLDVCLCSKRRKGEKIGVVDHVSNGRKNETHDPRHFIPYKLGGMVAVSIMHQEVIPQRPGQHR